MLLPEQHKGVALIVWRLASAMLRVRRLFKCVYFVLFTSVVVFFVFMSLLPKLGMYETTGFPAADIDAHRGQWTLASEDVQNNYDLMVTDVPLTAKNDTSKMLRSTLNLNFDVNCLKGDDHHYRMVVGILSAKRSPPTVVKMVQELVRPINGTKDYKLIVWRSESTSDDVRTAEELSELGTSVVINTHPYPELDPNRLKITFNDSVSRVLWRTSHVLDYANLLELAFRHDTEFIMVLEDDLKPAKFALDKSYQFAKDHFSSASVYSKWGLLTMYSTMRRMEPIYRSSGYLCFCGACALIIRKEIITDFINFLREDPYAAPVDMMLWNFLTKRKLYTYERTPNLFQHISLSSTYTAEDQNERKTEGFRSVSFEFDEDNRTAIPGFESKGGYVGCFKDRPEDRDFIGMYSLPSNGEKEAQTSPELCEDFCNGYYYFALQNGDNCYCGNRFGKYGAAAEKDCNQICKGDTAKLCGGTLRNSVYRTSTSFYYYVGCKVGNREQHGTTALSADNVFPGKCKQFCKDQPYFAIYGGNNCVCLDSIDKLVKRRQFLCSKLCTGNPNFTCGGNTAKYMSVYEIAPL